MANINLITYSGSLVTPQCDALMNDAELSNNGMFFGGEVSASSADTLEISHGFGVIYGREFEIMAQSITVQLATSGTLLGRVYINLDLNNQSQPIDLLYVTGASLPELVDNPNINQSSGSTQMEIATFTVDTSSVSNVVNTVPTVTRVADAIKSANNGLATINNYLTNTVAPIARHNVTYAKTGEGDGIILQAGGTTIVAGGEAGTALVANNINDTAAGTVESVHVAADNMIYFYSNCQTIVNRKQMTFSTSGNLAVPGTVSTGGKELYPITYAPATFDLHKATWKKATGLYYAEFPVNGWKWIFGLAITSWGGLNALVVPYIVSANKIGFMTTASSFPSTSAAVALRIMGVLS